MYTMTYTPDDETTTVTVETKEVLTTELIRIFGDFLIACGHHPDNVSFHSE